jgi:hypothetical protein
MQSWQNSVLRNKPLHLPPAVGKMRVHLGFSQAIVIQVIDAGGCELGVQGAQVSQVEVKFMAVVDAGEKSHQSPALARPGVLLDGFDDLFKTAACALHDLVQVLRGRRET